MPQDFEDQAQEIYKLCRVELMAAAGPAQAAVARSYAGGNSRVAQRLRQLAAQEGATFAAASAPTSYAVTAGPAELVAFLAALRAVGGGVVRWQGTGADFTWLEGLLKKQPSVKALVGGALASDRAVVLPATSAALGAACKAFGRDLTTTASRPWLEAGTRFAAEIIVSCNKHGAPDFPWRQFCRSVSGRALFVGSDDDYTWFVAQHGWIGRAEVRDAQDLAAVVNAAHGVVADWGLAASLAEALGKTLLLVGHQPGAVRPPTTSAWQGGLPAFTAGPPEQADNGNRGQRAQAPASALQWKRLPEIAADGATFYHCGDYGDTLYSLPAMQALGGGTICLGVEFKLKHPTTTRAPYTRKAVDRILAPLLRIQPYIRGVVWSEQMPAVHYDLNKGRELMWEWRYWELPEVTQCRSLAQFHLDAFRLGTVDESQPWLTVDSTLEIPGKPIVVARSQRYRNVNFPWQDLVRDYGKLMVFVGLWPEYEDFCRSFGPVAWQSTEDFLNLARVIAAAKLFVGNQSAPYAIAEGLKVPTLQETCLHGPDCVFDREKTMYVRRQGYTAIKAHVESVLA